MTTNPAYATLRLLNSSTGALRSREFLPASLGNSRPGDGAEQVRGAAQHEGRAEAAGRGQRADRERRRRARDATEVVREPLRRGTDRGRVDLRRHRAEAAP